MLSIIKSNVNTSISQIMLIVLNSSIHQMPIDNQCILCGQLMGLVQFSDSMFGSSPILYCFKKEKIAVKHVGQYSFVSGIYIK